MSVVPDDRNIKKLRTFAEDFKRAQSNRAEETLETTSFAATTPPTTTKFAHTDSESDRQKDPKPKSIPKTDPAITPQKLTLPVVEKKPAPQPTKTPTPTPKYKPLRKLNKNIPISKLGTPEANLPTNVTNSLLTTEDDVFDVTAAHKGDEGGSIVTDQKQKRFKVIPATIEMLTQWISTNIERFGLFKSSADYEEVDPQSERSDEQSARVLEKASQLSAHTPTDDFAMISKKRRQAKTPKPLSDPFVIGDSESAGPSWTHQIGDGEVEQVPNIEPLNLDLPLEDTVPEPLVEESIPEPEPPIEEPVLKPEPLVEESIPEPGWTPWLAEPSSQEISEPEAESTTAVVLPPEDQQQQTTDDLVYEEYTPPPEPQADVENKTTYAWSPNPAPNNRYFIFQLVVVVIGAVVLGVGTTVWLFGGSDNDPTTFTPQVVALIQAEETIAIPLQLNREDLLSSIRDVNPRTTTLIAHVYPTVDVVGKNTPATTEEILNSLDLQAPLSFQRTITEINFGLYRSSEPFIIMRINSFDEALSGMISWETTMSADLAPLFGNVVRGTFDPNSRTATQVVAPFFFDTSVVNQDTRVLVNELQDDAIAYSFLDRNTILITTTRSALESLVPAIR